MRRPVNRDVHEGPPIFGIDTQEIEVLRNLEKVVWMYIHDDASMGDLVTAANQVRLAKRQRIRN